MIFEPTISLALWGLLATAAVVLLAWYAISAQRRLSRRRHLLVLLLMTGAIAVPLFILLGPTLVEPAATTEGRSRLTILIDRSESMKEKDGGDSTELSEPQARIDRAVSIASDVARQLDDRFEVRIRSFAGNLESETTDSLPGIEASGIETDLAGALLESVVDESPAGQAVLVLSDGIHNTRGGTDAIRDALVLAGSGTRDGQSLISSGAVVYTKTIGGPVQATGLDIVVSNPQQLARPGQKTTIVSQLIYHDDRPAEVALTLSCEEKDPIEKSVTLAPNETTEVTFEITEAETGLYHYQLSGQVNVEGKKVVTADAAVLLRVVHEQVGVMLLEGKPYWDTKFLLRALSMDDAIDLTAIIRMGQSRFVRRRLVDSETSEEAESRQDAFDVVDLASSMVESLEGKQVVILGRDVDIFLTDEFLERLRQWIAEDGGRLVCFRGMPSARLDGELSTLLPVRPKSGPAERYQLRLTEAGKTLRWISPEEADTQLSQLPELETQADADQLRPLAVVLAEAERGGDNSAPLISYQPYGAGRIVMVEGSGMWRWAFLPPSLKDNDEIHGKLWRNLIRWLTVDAPRPSCPILLRSDKVLFSTTDNVTATLTLADGTGATPPRVELSGASLTEPREVTAQATRAGTTSEGMPQAAAGSGLYRIALGRLPEGTYRLKVVDSDDPISAAATLTVQKSGIERRNLSARPGLMQEIARATGGEALDSVDPADLASRFDAYLAKTYPDRLVKMPLWDRWWMLLAVVLLTSSCWTIRRRSGLI